MANPTYRLDYEIDRGQFGTVYRAHHSVLPNRHYAIKLIPAGPQADVVLEEARKAAALPDHPNVVKVHDAGIWDIGVVYIVSDLCLNGSLDDQAKGGPFDPGSACVVVAEACRGLSHLHHAGLLHLDIRPANIMLSEDGKPRLTDFGLARWAHDAAVEMWYGPHAAPEFVETGEATVQSDIYSMAMTLAHLLTGGSICRAWPELGALVAESADGTWPRLDELGLNVTSRLRKVIAHATEYDPAKRPKDVAAFKRGLDSATPRVSFNVRSDGSLVSVNGRWEITDKASARGRHSVNVKRKNRRMSELSFTDATPAAARKHVRNVVKMLAEQPEAWVTRRRGVGS